MTRTLIIAAALVGPAAGCHRTHPGGATTHQADAARRQADRAAADAVRASADAIVSADPSAAAPPSGVFGRLKHKVFGSPTVPVSVTVPTAPRSPPPPAAEKEKPSAAAAGRAPVVETVRSATPHATVAEAEADAYEVARKVIAERLAEQTPPVRHVPPLSAVRDQYVRKGSRAVRPPTEVEKETFEKAGVTGNLVYVEYTVEVTDDHLRLLRAQDRVSDALRVTGGLLVVCAAAFLFLRADEWSRGYLTSWLGLLAGLFVAAGVVAAMTVGW